MENLPKRKLTRLKEFDYSQNGYYFITICTKNKECLFGTIVDEKMILNKYGNVVENNINIVSNYKEEISIEKYCIMPNHIHLIILICRERIVCVPNEDRTKMIISKVIQQFKSSITKKCNEIANGGTHTMRSLQWQKSFHDHIIRNEEEYIKIWHYIDTNPLKWELDCYNPNSEKS